MNLQKISTVLVALCLASVQSQTPEAQPAKEGLFVKDTPDLARDEKSKSEITDTDGSRSLTPIKEETKNVEFITVLFRHGHRTPHKIPYPSYPNQNETYYPYGLGQLTNQGKRREYGIGQALRRRYSRLLGSLVMPDTVTAKSTATRRTKQSLLLLLAALYPPRSLQRWDFMINWQPIAFTYVALPRDIRFFGAFCRKAKELAEEFKRTPEYQTISGKYSDAFAFLIEKTGFADFDLSRGFNLYLNFVALSDMRETLPSWAKTMYPEPLRSMTADYYKVKVFSTESLRYAAGFLMKQILAELDAKIGGTAPKNQKVSLYSGHELNVAFMLMLLDVYDDSVPPFGAYITLELHNNNGLYGIKILYEDYKGTQPKVLTMPGCLEICPFGTFKELVKDNLPGPEEEKCVTHEFTFSDDEETN